jgi:hypothetical protein
MVWFDVKQQLLVPKFGFIALSHIRAGKLCVIALTSSLLLSGCLLERDCIPTGCGGPERLVPVNQELASIAAYADYPDVLSRYTSAGSLDAKKAVRNEFIFDRIYAMDVKYTTYEESLTKESQSEGFWAAVTNAALTGTAALIPVAQTAQILSAVAAGLTTTDQAYSKQFLYSRAVQILQSKMRAKRSTIVSQIVLRANKPVTEYPLGMAMADLEEYYRAGTLSSAFIDLQEGVGSEAIANRAVKDELKGGGAKVHEAQIRAGTTGNVNTSQLRSPPDTGTRAIAAPDESTAILRKFIARDAPPDHMEAVTAFLTRIGLTFTDLPLFLRGAEFRTQRQQLVSELRSAGKL